MMAAGACITISGASMSSSTTAVQDRRGLWCRLLKPKGLGAENRDRQIEVDRFSCKCLSKSRQRQGKLLGFRYHGRCLERVVQPFPQVTVGKQVEPQHGG